MMFVKANLHVLEDIQDSYDLLLVGALYALLQNGLVVPGGNGL